MPERGGVSRTGYVLPSAQQLEEARFARAEVPDFKTGEVVLAPDREYVLLCDPVTTHMRRRR